MVGVGLPPAGQRNLTVLAAGTACSRFSIFSVLVQYGAPELEDNVYIYIHGKLHLHK